MGHARHSETLEEMALYDCLYPNDLGKTWVRPLDLFYGEIEVAGRSVRRFAPVALDIQCVESLTQDHFDILNTLSAKIFEKDAVGDLSHDLRKKKDVLLLLARVEGQVVGYKVGYHLEEDVFYNWLGGVLPEYRGLGIATALLRAQHDWCQSKGYKKVQTKTGNQFSQMLILNIKAGFKIMSAHTGAHDGAVRIILEKDLKNQ